MSPVRQWSELNANSHKASRIFNFVAVKDKVCDPMDTVAELAMLKAQMATLMGAMEGEAILDIKSIWAVHSPSKQSTWCSKSDCPKLGRKTTYDIVTKDKDLEEVITQGVSEEASNTEDVIKKVKRVGSPTVKLHDLGILAAFTSKIKAQSFITEYFEANQDSNVAPLQMTEIKVIA